ncbi:hypothetical protein GCM10018963_53820 [Saccharothrix longispora]
MFPDGRVLVESTSTELAADGRVLTWVDGYRQRGGAEGAGVGTKGGHKRRQAVRRRERGEARARAQQTWFTRQSGLTQVAVSLGALGLLVGGHFLLWGAVIPAVGALVGRVPVVSTLVGWLFAGGVFAAGGVLAVNQHTAAPATVKRLDVVLGVWLAVAVCSLPVSEYADDVSLPLDYWAGVYSGGSGMLVSPVVAGVVALGWWLFVNKLAGREARPKTHHIGWMCIGYSVLLLVWGSTLLRM